MTSRPISVGTLLTRILLAGLLGALVVTVFSGTPHPAAVFGPRTVSTLSSSTFIPLMDIAPMVTLSVLISAVFFLTYRHEF